MSRARFGRHPAGSLADDLDILDECEGKLPVRIQVLPNLRSREGASLPGRVERMC